jgi:hypothetical protein
LSAAPPNIAEAVTSVERIVRDSRAGDAVLRNIRSLFKRQPSIKAPLNFIEVRRAAGSGESAKTASNDHNKWDLVCRHMVSVTVITEIMALQVRRR